MKTILKKHAGIIIGALYALVLRLVFNVHEFAELFNLFSLTFVWLTPVGIGIIPLLYASKDQLKSWGYRISSPVWTVSIFFLLCFLTRLEDLICLFVLLIPYILIAATAGLIAGEIIERARIKKRTLYTILLFPFVVSPIEQQFSNPVNDYVVATKITIDAKAEIIWQNIVRVRLISEAEYSRGFFNYAGIPRPLYAELDKDTLGATRIGHFEDGLQFVETVQTWERNKQIRFNITVIPSTIRKTVFDQHLLKGNHFRFLNAEYFLKELPNGKTELTLTSSYQLNTKINTYGSFWGNQFLTDFQDRLLQVIKARCEN